VFCIGVRFRSLTDFCCQTLVKVTNFSCQTFVKVTNFCCQTFVKVTNLHSSKQYVRTESRSETLPGWRLLRHFKHLIHRSTFTNATAVLITSKWQPKETPRRRNWRQRNVRSTWKVCKKSINCFAAVRCGFERILLPPPSSTMLRMSRRFTSYDTAKDFITCSLTWRHLWVPNGRNFPTPRKIHMCDPNFSTLH
jgi:hypothetical protein